MSTTQERLIERIMVLNDRVWEGRLPRTKVDQWLENFTGRIASVESERLHALFWLSQFMYFGSREIRVLLKSLYRDLYLCPTIQEVKLTLPVDASFEVIQAAVAKEIKNTRFIGVGNPSESGVHLLYYFRQENRLSKKNFMDAMQIFKRDSSANRSPRRIREPNLTRYIFLDDICGSGQTAIDYSNEIIGDLVALDPNVKFAYFSMFATADGLRNVRTNSLFGERCGAVYELDVTYKCLENDSRYFSTKEYPEIVPELARRVVQEYGEFIGYSPTNARGFKNSQMLIGFHHNTPDNTLPIIWADSTVHGGNSWFPAFKRYPKFMGEDI